ncbi:MULTISPECIES: hypothetical protein [unclassified Microbacterium]|uniref:hypothetical protein n=1 Tax=unclassified Microbacterium TaxID=2609290 RepID=UPI003862F345
MAENEQQHDPEEMPDTEELEEPSVAKEPGEEPKAPEKKDEEPSHHAVGIGIVESETVSTDDEPQEA